MSKSYRVVGLCSALGCSERYLYAVFLRDIGLPPKTWMDLERMVVARRMLEGGKSVEEVADGLGFMSVESFRRKFMKVYKVSPGRFLRGLRVFDPYAEDTPQDAGPKNGSRRKKRKAKNGDE